MVEGKRQSTKAFEVKTDPTSVILSGITGDVTRTYAFGGVKGSLYEPNKFLANMNVINVPDLKQGQSETNTKFNERKQKILDAYNTNPNVEKIERSPSYMLCDPVQSTYAVQLKRGSKHETQTISNGVTYTPDYDIYFTAKALDKFCWELGSGTKWNKNLLVAQKLNVHGKILYRACIEVKPDFSRNSTTPKSVQSMKWLMQRHGVFVNLFRPNRIFEGLFTPGKYLITERGTPRKLKFRPKSLGEYLKHKK